MVRAQAVDAENFLDSLEQAGLRNWRVENGRFRQRPPVRSQIALDSMASCQRVQAAAVNPQGPSNARGLDAARDRARIDPSLASVQTDRSSDPRAAPDIHAGRQSSRGCRNSSGLTLESELFLYVLVAESTDARSIGARRQAEDSAIDVDWNTTGRNWRMKSNGLNKKYSALVPSS